MALYIPHSIFHLKRLLYVRPETFALHYVSSVITLEGLLFIHKYPLLEFILSKFFFTFFCSNVHFNAILLYIPSSPEGLHSSGSPTEIFYHMIRNFLFRCCVWSNVSISISGELVSLSCSVTELKPYRVLNDLPQTRDTELNLSTSGKKIWKYINMLNSSCIPFDYVLCSLHLMLLDFMTVTVNDLVE